MSNKVIAETSRIEGDYGEYLNMYAFKVMGKEYIDVSGNPEYQKKDIDLLLKENNNGIEIKSDYRAVDTGNLPFEIITHLDAEHGKGLSEAFKNSNSQYATLNDVVNMCSEGKYSIGCNLKCEADYVYYYYAREENGIDKSKRYKTVKIRGYNNKTLQNYFKNPQNKFKVRFVYQKEDKAYNVILLENINKLDEIGIGHEPKEEYMNALRSLKDSDGNDIFHSYHTSEEIGRLCGLLK